MGKAGEYLQRAGVFALESLREGAQRQADEQVDEERDFGIMKTTSALYDAKVKDDMIIRLLQKHWGLTITEARERLRIEKMIQHPCTELADYLMDTEAMTLDEANDFIFDNDIPEYLKRNKGAWKLSPQELLKEIEGR